MIPNAPRYQSLKAEYKTWFHRQHTKQVTELLRTEGGLKGRFARQVARRWIKQRLWEERQASKR